MHAPSRQEKVRWEGRIRQDEEAVDRCPHGFTGRRTPQVATIYDNVCTFFSPRLTRRASSPYTTPPRKKKRKKKMLVICGRSSINEWASFTVGGQRLYVMMLLPFCPQACTCKYKQKDELSHSTIPYEGKL